MLGAHGEGRRSALPVVPSVAAPGLHNLSRSACRRPPVARTEQRRGSGVQALVAFVDALPGSFSLIRADLPERLRR